jgi:hypothetical protein
MDQLPVAETMKTDSNKMAKMKYQIVQTRKTTQVRALAIKSEIK